MKITTIINGKKSIILTPENDIEKLLLKDMNGAEVSTVGSGNNILQNNVEGSLIIQTPSSSDNRNKQS